MRPLRSVSCRSLPRPSCLAIVTTFVLVTVCALPGAADWRGSGLPITALPGDQSSPRVAPDGSGGIYVAWQDGRALPDGGLRLIRLTAEGVVAPGWPAGGLRPGEGLLGEVVALFPDEAAGAVLAGELERDAFCSHTRLWHFGTGADSLGGTSPNSAYYEAVAPGDSGVVLSITYVEPGNCGVGMHRIFTASRIDDADSFVWGNSVDLWSGQAGWAAICSDQAGGGYVLEDTGLIIQRLDSTGAVAAGWPAAGHSISATVGSDGSTYLLVPNTDHGAIVVWHGTGSQPGDLPRLYAARVAAGGTTIVAEQQLTDDSSLQEGALAVPKGGGGAVLAWSNYLDGVGPAQVYAVVLPAFGDLPRTSFPVAPSPWDQWLRDVAWDGATGGYVAWVGRNTAGDTTGLYVQRFTSASVAAPGWPEGGVRLCALNGGQVSARLAVSGGQPYVVWHDIRRTATDPGAGYDVYAAKLTPDGTVPVLASLVEAVASPDGVRLRWWAARGPTEARVQRSVDGAAWSDIGGAARDGLGYYAFTDATTAPGDRFAYRLATALGEPLCAAAWVSVPAGPRLALGLVDLAASPPSVHLTLAGDGPARLEVFDVQGRRLQTLDLGSGGAGEHVLALRGGLAPGVLVLRLSQAGVSVTKRAVRLR